MKSHNSCKMKALLQGSVYHLVPEAPLFKGNTDGAQGIFETAQRVWAPVLSLVTTKKGLVYVGRPTNKLYSRFQQHDSHRPFNHFL